MQFKKIIIAQNLEETNRGYFLSDRDMLDL